MLKSPRYSSAQPTSIFSQISSTLADRFNGTKRAQANSSTQQAENKLHTLLYKYGNNGTIGNRPSVHNRSPSSTSLARIAPNVAVSKAQSSLASSTYQAHAHLPQFEGAGKAHASSVYRGQGTQHLPQVRLPSEDSYTDRQSTAEASSNRIHSPSTRTASTIYHNPVNFGYDGVETRPHPRQLSTQRTNSLPVQHSIPWVLPSPITKISVGILTTPGTMGLSTTSSRICVDENSKPLHLINVSIRRVPLNIF